MLFLNFLELSRIIFDSYTFLIMMRKNIDFRIPLLQLKSNSFNTKRAMDKMNNDFPTEGNQTPTEGSKEETKKMKKEAQALKREKRQALIAEMLKRLKEFQDLTIRQLCQEIIGKMYPKCRSIFVEQFLNESYKDEKLATKFVDSADLEEEFGRYKFNFTESKTREIRRYVRSEMEKDEIKRQKEMIEIKKQQENNTWRHLVEADEARKEAVRRQDRSDVMNIFNTKEAMTGLIKTVEDCVVSWERLHKESLLYVVEETFGIKTSFETTKEFFKNETDTLAEYALKNRIKFLSELADLIENRKNICYFDGDYYNGDYIDHVCHYITDYAKKFRLFKSKVQHFTDIYKHSTDIYKHFSSQELDGFVQRLCVHLM